LRFKRARKCILLPTWYGAHGKVSVCRAAVMENADASSADEFRVSRIRSVNLYSFAVARTSFGELVELRRESTSLWSTDDRYDLLTCDYASLAFTWCTKDLPETRVCVCVCVVFMCMRASRKNFSYADLIFKLFLETKSKYCSFLIVNIYHLYMEKSLLKANERFKILAGYRSKK